MRSKIGLVLAAICSCGYIVTFFLTISGGVLALDASLVLQINGLAATPLVGVSAAFITEFGGDIIQAVIALAIFVLIPSDRKFALKLAGALILSDFAVFLLRTGYARPRPDLTISGLILPLGRVSDPSFPSGHATRIFSFACVVVAVKGRKYFPALVLAMAVGVSRIILGLHYPLDIVSGAFLGILIGVTTHRT